MYLGRSWKGRFKLEGWKTYHCDESSIFPANKQKSPNILYNRPSGEAIPMVLIRFFVAGTIRELCRDGVAIEEFRFREAGAALRLKGLAISDWLLWDDREGEESFESRGVGRSEEAGN